VTDAVDVGSNAAAAAVFCEAEAIIVDAGVFPETGAAVPDAGAAPDGDVLFETAADPADDAPVEADGEAGAAGGAIHTPESDASSVGWAHEPDVGGVLAFAAGPFSAVPITGGIPKPAGEVGFAAAAPPAAESVSNSPSGSNS
jgi:hypothetical protein